MSSSKKVECEHVWLPIEKEVTWRTGIMMWDWQWHTEKQLWVVCSKCAASKKVEEVIE